MPKPSFALPLALAALAISAAPAFAQSANIDPYEGFNRGSFAFTEAADKAIIGPVARTYLKAPKPARDGVHNVLENLNEPLNVLNQLLQLRVGRAIHDTGRFAINTTVGIGGLFDNANRMGLEPKPTDFGVTFARYGVGTGGYFYVPLYGPSTVRDSVGLVASIVLDPLNIPRYHGKTEVAWGRVLMIGLDTRARFDGELTELRRSATDPYVSLRSLYLQNRAAQISGGKLDVEALPSFDAEPTAPAPAPPAGPAT